MKKKLNNRGSILIYSLLIMTIILSVGLSLNTLFLRNLRTIGAARDSVIALYSADSGMETCLYETRSGMTVDRQVLRDVMFEVTDLSTGMLVTGDCTMLGTGSLEFRVTGTYRNSSRALQISQ
ncbi:MAG TPA: pilus assembly PilX N-terminal domain-containing protein [Candidatus Paceibacterota bacterium]|nr:pilus assembly PilX N-terminal domain-containing protein [Candidatus Paceibacterota bacterium]